MDRTRRPEPGAPDQATSSEHERASETSGARDLVRDLASARQRAERDATLLAETVGRALDVLDDRDPDQRARAADARAHLGSVHQSLRRTLSTLADLEAHLAASLPGPADTDDAGPVARVTFTDIVGRSTALKRRLVLAEAAARSPSCALITGEAGTGKELFARAIHNAGPRARHPLLRVACAAVASASLERTLFGDTTHDGALAGSAGRTVLLDDIDRLPASLQHRVLQSLRFDRDSGPEQDAPRLIATTTRDLGADVGTGAFSRDLYEHLRVVHIDLPPLRERSDDIEPLARHFVRAASARHGKHVRDVASPALEALRRHSWPGNVAELERVLDAEVARAAPGQAELVTPPAELVQSPAPAPAQPDLASGSAGGDVLGRLAAAEREGDQAARTMSEIERELIESALATHRGNIPSVARTLGVSRGTIYNKMKKFGIDPARYRT